LLFSSFLLTLHTYTYTHYSLLLSFVFNFSSYFFPLILFNISSSFSTYFIISVFFNTYCINIITFSFCLNSSINIFTFNLSFLCKYWPVFFLSNLILFTNYLSTALLTTALINTSYYP